MRHDAQGLLALLGIEHRGIEQNTELLSRIRDRQPPVVGKGSHLVRLRQMLGEALKVLIYPAVWRHAGGIHAQLVHAAGDHLERVHPDASAHGQVAAHDAGQHQRNGALR